MKHVFVESNWVFDVCSPTHRRKPEAERLVERAKRGELELHLPGICLREGSESVRRKCQPRLGDLGEFRRMAEKAGRLSASDGATVTRLFEQYTADVRNDLDGIDAQLDALRRAPGLNVFALSDSRLNRVLLLRATVTEVADLKPFDEATP